MKSVQDKLSEAAYSKEDFVPQVGDTVRFNWKRQEDEFWQLNEYTQGKIDYITSSGVVIDDCFFDYADDTVDIQPVKSEAEKRRDEQHDKIVSVIEAKEYDDIDECAEALYQAGCRMTRELNHDDVMRYAKQFGLWGDRPYKLVQFANSIQAYITGSE